MKLIQMFQFAAGLKITDSLNLWILQIIDLQGYDKITGDKKVFDDQTTYHPTGPTSSALDLALFASSKSSCWASLCTKNYLINLGYKN